MTRLLGPFLFFVTIAAVPALEAQNGGNGASSNAGAGLNGTWLIRGGRGGQTKYPQSQWLPGELPFTPAGKKAFDGNKSGKGPRQVPPAFGNDPLSNANPPGLYRALIYSRPVEMFTMPGKVVQLFEWSKFWRVIYTDGRPVPKDVPQGPFWYGYSVGHWEGDTLVATTVALDGRAWLDEWGTPFSDNARVEERWRRTAPDKVELTITVNDPLYYTNPWTSDPKIFNADNEELFEVVFAPMDENVFNQRIRNPAGGLKK
jgi:hypothetical protein